KFIKDDYTMEFPAGHSPVLRFDLELKPNTSYTYTHNTDYMRWYINKINDDGSSDLFEYDANGGYKVHTFNTGEHSTFRLVINTHSKNIDKNRFIKKLKLEKGNKPTDWTPAPEDYQSQIDNQGNILTKHETEIEQNKLCLNSKVSYTEMNGTNKTLEKLLTEFSQTADGFNFRIDSNGMIQDLTFDRNAFKLNSNLIEFNDGDVIIKDGRTTIKDAFIHNLAS